MGSPGWSMILTRITATVIPPLPAGERSKPERQRRLRVRGVSTHLDSRTGPSPAAHLAMRVDLSPAGRGKKKALQPNFITFQS
jgi:hypothetical protein